MATVEELYDKDKVENYYGLTRTDVLAFLKPWLQSSGKSLKNVLEIGCSRGGTGKVMKETMGVQYYAGVELMSEAVAQAKENIDWVMQGNIETMIAENRLGEIPAKQYDAILFLDVLEHLYNPWKVLEACKELLAPGGVLIGSIPNAGNLYVVWKLLRDRFEYDDEGLLDRTHIRFFTKHTIEKMVAQHFNMQHMGTNHNTWKTMNKQQKFFYLLTLGQWKKLFVRQYLFVAERKK